ncbi:MAG: 16S rRNA (guanine(966)-N(2))-methyltransferase RsmD [Bacteroidales bacterium]|nr:16S rRNA (guanine(966)-N(2))-methyltransferase RsmD [Bacteroidales bacterium]
MRIISGTYRGKQIRPPKKFKVRPTTDFAKESLFNILLNQFDLGELDVLDLFAGTGSITYEFASRGARSVVAVERDPDHFHFIRRMCDELEMDLVTVIRGDAFRYLKKPYQSFDIIFADPPFDHSRIEALPDMIFETKILANEGQFILEHPGNHSFTAHPRFMQHRKYGGVNFSFFG